MRQGGTVVILREAGKLRSVFISDKNEADFKNDIDDFKTLAKDAGFADKIVVGFQPEEGFFADVALTWTRESENETISNSEKRAIEREAQTRALELARGKGWEKQGARLADCSVRMFYLDGRKVFNPAGFRGRKILMLGRYIFLFPKAAEFLDNIREMISESKIFVNLIDAAVVNYFESKKRASVIFLGEESTSLMFLKNGQVVFRELISFGSESVKRHFARGFGFSSSKEAERVLKAADRGSLSKNLTKRVEAFLAPVGLSWVRSIIESSPSKDFFENMIFVSLYPLEIPFKKLLVLPVLRKVLVPNELSELKVADISDLAPSDDIAGSAALALLKS